MWAALPVIYVLPGVLCKSYIHPITIFAGLPSAAIGALATLMLFGQDLTLISTIGIALLIGIVKKNAIMMSTLAALLAALLVALTIALTGALTGAGAELRQPLGLVIPLDPVR